MSDDKSKSQGQDRQRINVHQDYELRDWSRKFGVSPEELKRAVAKVGDRATDVERELKAK
jgi:AraC-like DNA-binding protein